MNNILKRLICISLSIVMSANATVACFAHENEPEIERMVELKVGPEEAKKALESVGDAAKNLKIDAGGKVSNFFSGLSSVAKGANFVFDIMGKVNTTVSFLKLVGLLEDDGQMSIMQGIANIQKELRVINEKLDQISKDIKDLSIDVKEKDRANKAITMNSNWNTFETNYIEKLDGLMSDYNYGLKAKTNDWYNKVRGSEESSIEVSQEVVQEEISEDSITTDGEEQEFIETLEEENAENNIVEELEEEIIEDNEQIDEIDDNEQPSFFVYYGVVDGKETVVYSRKNNESVQKADDGTVISKKISIPCDIFHNLPEWDQNKYVEDIKTVISNYVKSEMGYDTSKAKQFADDAFNSLQYRLSCEFIDKNDGNFISAVDNKFEYYLENTCKQTTGLDSQMQLLLNTYAFEGEARQKIETATDNLLVRTGLYGAFALDVLGKSKLTDRNRVKSFTENWIQVLEYINSVKANAITGYDNFCYLTNTRIFLGNVELKSEVWTDSTEWRADFRDHERLEGSGWTGWQVSYLNQPDGKKEKAVSCMDYVQLSMMYHFFQKSSSKSDKADFGDYLKNNKADNGQTVGDRIVNITENGDFLLSENYTMNVTHCNGSYFRNGTKTIGDGGHKSDRMVLHKHVVGSVLDLEKKKISLKEMIAADAMYREGNWYWYIDECGYFNSQNTTSSRDTKEIKDELFRYTMTTIGKAQALYSLPIEKKAIETLGEVEDSAIDPLSINSQSSWIKPETIPECEDTAVCEPNTIIEDFVDKEDDLLDYIKSAAQEAKVSISDAEAMSIKSDMEKQIKKQAQVAKENKNLLVKDPLGINGDVSKLSKLVKAVYGNDYPVTKENRKQFAVRIYIEPVAVLRFEKKKPVLYEAYDVSLHLVENKYVLANEDYENPIFEIVEINNVITDDVLKSLGWKATLRLPTVLAGNNSVATIEHFDGKIADSMNLLEKFEKRIQSTGNGKYVELKVSQTSPFVLTYSKESNNNQKTRTSVSTNISLWISLFVVSAGLIVVLIKKKRV